MLERMSMCAARPHPAAPAPRRPRAPPPRRPLSGRMCVPPAPSARPPRGGGPDCGHDRGPCPRRSAPGDIEPDPRQPLPRRRLRSRRLRSRDIEPDPRQPLPRRQDALGDCDLAPPVRNLACAPHRRLLHLTPVAGSGPHNGPRPARASAKRRGLGGRRGGGQPRTVPKGGKRPPSSVQPRRDAKRALISEVAISEVAISEVAISEVAISEVAISEVAISEVAISEVAISAAIPATLPAQRDHDGGDVVQRAGCERKSARRHWPTSPRCYVNPRSRRCDLGDTISTHRRTPSWSAAARPRADCRRIERCGRPVRKSARRHRHTPRRD